MGIKGWQLLGTVLLSSILLSIQQCAWFRPDPVESIIVKPVPIDGYSGLSTRIHYPKAVREKGIEGTVVVKAFVSEKGVVTETRLAQKLDPELDRIAENAIQRTQFSPALRDDIPEAAWISIPISYALKDWRVKTSPFSGFKMFIKPNSSYEKYELEIRGQLKKGLELPLRFECLLPFNVDQTWVRSEDGTVITSGIVRDESGEWLIFEAYEESFTAGFNYLTFDNQNKYKFQYKFVLNHSLPPWNLGVLYGDQKVQFSQEPDRSVELTGGQRIFQYDQKSLEAFEPRYIEIERIDL